MRKKAKAKAVFDEVFEDIVLSDRNTLAELLKAKKLYDMDGVAKITGLCVPYLRQLCHDGKIAHHKLLGRYYMTPADVADLLEPMKPATR